MYVASSSCFSDSQYDASIASAPMPIATTVSRNARRETIRPDGSSYTGNADGAGGTYGDQPIGAVDPAGAPAPTATGTCAGKCAKHCEHHVAASGDAAPHDVQLRTS